MLLGHGIKSRGTSGNDFLPAPSSAGDPQGVEVAQTPCRTGVEQLLFVDSIADDSRTGKRQYCLEIIRDCSLLSFS